MLLDNITAVVLVLCWAVFVIYWFVSALFAKKTIEKPKGFNVRQLMLISAIIFSIILIYSEISLPITTKLIPHTEISELAGDVISIFGLAGAVWARKTLGKNWSGTPSFKKNHELIISGPYKFVRHPIYSSLLLMMTGMFIYLGNIIMLFFIIFEIPLILIRIKQEEKIMINHFGEKYLDYRKKTKMIIPFIL